MIVMEDVFGAGGWLTHTLFLLQLQDPFQCLYFACFSKFIVDNGLPAYGRDRESNLGDWVHTFI